MTELNTIAAKLKLIAMDVDVAALVVVEEIKDSGDTVLGFFVAELGCDAF